MPAKRLPSEIVNKIRELRKQGLSVAEIASELGVSEGAASKYSRDVESETKQGTGVELTEEEFASLPPETKAELNRLRAEREKLRLEVDMAKLQGQKEVDAEVITNIVVVLATLCQLPTLHQETMINEFTQSWKALITVAEKLKNLELTRYVINCLWASLGYNNFAEFQEDIVKKPKYMEAYGLSEELLKRVRETSLIV